MESTHNSLIGIGDILPDNKIVFCDNNPCILRITADGKILDINQEDISNNDKAIADAIREFAKQYANK